MGNLSYKVALLLVAVSTFSCHPDHVVCCVQPSYDSSIVGKWDWVSVSEGNSINYNNASGIKRSLSFTADGHLYITHNDSSGISLLRFTPPGLLGRTETDTVGYYFLSAKAACVNFIYNALVVDTVYYQFFLSNDTLQFSTVPCLAPLVSTYVRGK